MVCGYSTLSQFSTTSISTTPTGAFGWAQALVTTAGSYLWRKTISTLTSSRSLCRKSFRKLETLSRVMWPQTTMCLHRRDQLVLARSNDMTPHPDAWQGQGSEAAARGTSISALSPHKPSPHPRGSWGKMMALAAAQRLLDRRSIWLLTWCCTKSY